MMPEPGEDTASVSDVFANVYAYCIELAAGRAAEQMLLGDDDTCSATDDRRQARELVLLFCKSEDAIESFITHCDIGARDLLFDSRHRNAAADPGPRLRRDDDT